MFFKKSEQIDRKTVRTNSSLYSACSSLSATGQCDSATPIFHGLSENFQQTFKDNINANNDINNNLTAFHNNNNNTNSLVESNRNEGNMPSSLTSLEIIPRNSLAQVYQVNNLNSYLTQIYSLLII